MLYHQAAEALGMPAEKFKLIWKGKAIENPCQAAGPSNSSTSTSSSAFAAPRKSSSGSSTVMSIQLQEGGERGYQKAVLVWTLRGGWSSHSLWFILCTYC